LAITGLRVDKEEDERLINVRQRFYADEVKLTIDRKRCIVCDICLKLCPKDAITLVESDDEVRITIDPQKCVLCGACEPLCPTNAVTLTLNGTRNNTLVKNGGFPLPLPKIRVDKEKCPADCTKCVDVCPVHAITIGAKHELAVNEADCLRCPWCVDACDKGAIIVNPMFLGSIRIDISKCSEGCDLCVKSCPTKAISLKNGSVSVSPRYCVLCGACLNVCKDNAIALRRYRVLAQDGFSAIWSSALKKLMDERLATRELDHRTKQKLISIMTESRSI